MTPPPTHPNDRRLRDLEALPAEDRAWLAALGGLTTPSASDPQSAHAQALRQYFAQRAAHEDAPVPATLSEARMLQRLRQAGVFDAPAAAAPARNKPAAAQAPSLTRRLQAVLDWLVPSGAGAGPRYALVSGLAVVVMVLPVVLQQPDAGDPAPVFRMGNPHNSGPVPMAGQLLLSTAPQQQAEQLLAQLQARGVQAQLQDQGHTVVLQAQVPPARQAAAQEALQPWGLQVPPDGQLRIHLQTVTTP